MAEAFLRSFVGDRLEVQSAGTSARGVHPLAVRVMAELGIDMSRQRSKTVDEVASEWDVVISVCDSACPIPPRAGLVLRWRFPDPTAARGTEEERLAAFRRVRDRLGVRVGVLAERLVPSPFSEVQAY